MKISSIMFEKKVTKEEKESLGQYSNEVLRLEGSISEGENVDFAIIGLMERVHIHLGVEFKSKVLEDLIQKSNEKSAEKEDNTPKEESKGDKDADNGGDKPTKKKPAKTKRAAGKKKSTEVAGDVREEKAATEEKKKEEVKEEKPKKVDGVVYDNSLLEHKQEFARILDEVFPQWRDSADNLKKAKEISASMVGDVLYNKSGKLASKFYAKVEELCK